MKTCMRSLASLALVLAFLSAAGAAFGQDVTPPAAGTVNDGIIADIDYQTSMTAISANWSGFGDPESGIAGYEWAIGTTSGGTEFQAFTSVGVATSAKNAGLTLSNGTTYFVTVRATNGAALQTSAASDGVTVDTSRIVHVTGYTIASNSRVFGDDSDNAWITAGDVTNDGIMDLVVSKHRDFGTGKIAVFQRSGASWDAGTVIPTATSGNGICLPSVGPLQHDGVSWVVYQVHGQGNSSGALEVSRMSGSVETKVLDSTGWPGALYPAIADLDGDGKLDVYASVQANGWFYKYTYDSGTDSYTRTGIATLGGGNITAQRPMVGDFAGVGKQSIIYFNGLNLIHHLTYNGSFVSTPVFTTPAWSDSLTSGQVDSAPGSDFVVEVNDSNKKPVYLVSGGNFKATIIAEPGELARVACADLDGDGRDEVYGGGWSTGNLYQFTPESGWRVMDRFPSMKWTEAVRVRKPGMTRDEVVFVCIENMNITIRALGLAPSGPTVSLPLGSTAPAAARFTADFTGAVLYQWDFDYDGKEFSADFVNSQTGTCSHTYTAPGAHSARIQVTFANGTVSYYDVSVTIAPSASAPTVTLTASPAAGTAPLPVGFTATVPPIFGRIESFEWDFDGDGTTDQVTTNDADTASCTYRRGDSFACRVKATSVMGASGVASVVVKVDPGADPPSFASFTASPSPAEAGQAVTFTAAASAGSVGGVARYEWDFDGNGGNDLVTTAGSAAHTYGKTGTYMARVRAIDDNGTPADPSDDLEAEAKILLLITLPVSSLRVWWAQPRDADRVRGNAVTLHVNAAPANRTAKVEFFRRQSDGGPHPSPGDFSLVKIG